MDLQPRRPIRDTIQTKNGFKSQNALRERNVTISGAVQIFDQVDCVGGPSDSKGKGAWLCFIRLGGVLSAMRGRK
jgi:hypothetical protein